MPTPIARDARSMSPAERVHYFKMLAWGFCSMRHGEEYADQHYLDEEWIDMAIDFAAIQAALNEQAEAN